MINVEPSAPLTRDETEALLLMHITTREELYRWEQDNMLEALAWLERRRSREILSEDFFLELHRRMFGNVWKWAGLYRTTDGERGAPWMLLPVTGGMLIDDVEFWINRLKNPPDVCAVHFHHRLVSLRLFPDGNGRHGRLMTDLLLQNVLERPRFSWGDARPEREGRSARQRYIEALQAADELDYGPLLEFVRS